MIFRVFWNILSKIAYFVKGILDKRAELNKRMKQHYSARLLALIGVGVCCFICVVTLFFPPFLGVANDSIGNQKMEEYGFTYRKADRGEAEDFYSNEYFTRSYEMNGEPQEIKSSHRLFLGIAKAMDNLVTGDNIFDVRFLALVYMFFYLPGVFLVLNSALERVRFFSEGVLLDVMGVLIFSDISYITYFNSLYEDALVFICLLYLAGAALSLHKERRWNVVFLLVLTVAGAILCTVEKRFFLVGMFFATFLFAQTRIFKKTNEKAVVMMMALVLTFCSIFSFFECHEDFDETGKFHAMTRGVLLQSENPDDVLEEIGIDVSYSILADCSLYEYYPVAEISNRFLKEGFLDQYSTMDIVYFYIRNPGAIISMWDMGVKAALNLRRDYCGNYERSTGMPPMGKSIFWSVWSIFKTRSAPQTIGYLALLILVFSIMSGRKVFNRYAVDRWNYVYFFLMLVMAVSGIADLTYVICKSGDAQFVQFNVTLGVVMDILLYYVAAEILHKLNIMEAEHEE